MKKNIVFLLGCLFFLNLEAQNDSLLMYVGGTPISKSEFIYAYHKNGHSSLSSFLSQFVRIKRWAYAAKELGLDTTHAFASNYSLFQQRMKNSIAKTVQYERNDDVDGSLCLAHLFVRIPQKTSYEDIDNIQCRFDSLYQNIYKQGGLGQWIQNNGDSLPKNWNAEVLKINSSQLVNDFSNCLDSLERGMVSHPFFSPIGIHMIQVVDNTKGSDCDSIDAVKLKDENWLLSEYRDGLLTRMLEDSLCLVSEGELEKYYKKHRKHYKWEYPHFKGIILQASDTLKLKNLEKCLSGYPQDMWIKIIKQLAKTDNFSWLKMDYGVFQIGTNACVDKLCFGQGNFKPLAAYPYVKILGKVLKKKPESYMDVYEKVKSDFCKQQIEKEDAFLKKKIKVEINEEVLKTVKNH